MTIFVFLLVSIISITSSELILSHSKYAKYDYEEVYLKEQCLSKIELVYSNVLKEVELALDKSQDSESFEEYFTENNSCDFINRISDISGVSIEDTKCSVDKIDYYCEEGSIYYRIVSEVEHKGFDKTIVANIKIKNPFLEDNHDKLKPSDLVVVFDCKEV